MQTVLLVLHVLAAALWLGGAAYERLFLAPELATRRRTPAETALVRLALRPAPAMTSVVALLVGTGLLLALAAGDGFFQPTWLGAKQAIVVAILAGYLYAIAPRLRRLQQAVRGLPDGAALAPKLRQDFQDLRRRLDWVHAGVLINVILAVWKPF